MRLPLSRLVRLVAIAGIIATVAVATAETWTLELKRLDAQDGSRPVSGPMDYIYRATYPQHFFVQMVPDGKGGVRSPGNEQQAAAFKKLVKKEPKYQSPHPFRAVAKVGLDEYAFALDCSAPKPAAKDEKPKTEKAKTQPKSDSAIDKLKEKLAKTIPPVKLPLYDRLCFDFNHNGDLTDDKVIEAKVTSGPGGSANSYSQLQFPRLDVKLVIDGTPMEAAFFLRGYGSSSSNFSYMQLQINAAAYREGQITLEGKKRHAVLIDFNSNGRFDDPIKIRKDVRRADGQIYPEQGDMLLIDPEKRSGIYDSPYDVTSSDYRYNVSKLVNIDGRFYDMKVAPAGDKLTLTPSTAPLGSVSNGNDGFRAIIYNDDLFLKIQGNKDAPVAVPEGQWKLLSYTINATETPQQRETAEKKAAKKQESKDSLLQSLAKQLSAALGGGVPVGGRLSIVEAQATTDYKAVKVIKGQTAKLPFGPPYKPQVTAPYNAGPGQMYLQMSLVGSAGEICSNMMARGGRPSKPEFTITDPKGKVVQQGSFEYG